MKIVDLDRKPIKACASFVFKGFVVSISTIFNDDVAVWKDGNDTNPIIFQGRSVADALDFILDHC